MRHRRDRHNEGTDSDGEQDSTEIRVKNGKRGGRGHKWGGDDARGAKDDEAKANGGQTRGVEHAGSAATAWRACGVMEMAYNDGNKLECRMAAVGIPPGLVRAQVPVVMVRPRGVAIVVRARGL
jgi:hypothetical protein